MLVDAPIHILLGVCALLHALATTDIVHVGSSAKRRARRAPKGLVGATSAHKLAGTWFLQLVSCSLADAIGQARIASTAAHGIICAVATRDIARSRSAVGVVAEGAGPGSQDDEQS